MQFNSSLVMKIINSKVDWMDDKTRKAALEKLEFMSSNVAYPDEILDEGKLEEHYRNLELTPGSYLKNVISESRFDFENDLKELRKPVDKKDWKTLAYPTMVNALYSENLNSIRKFLVIKIKYFLIS